MSRDDISESFRKRLERNLDGAVSRLKYKNALLFFDTYLSKTWEIIEHSNQWKSLCVIRRMKLTLLVSIIQSFGLVAIKNGLYKNE